MLGSGDIGWRWGVGGEGDVEGEEVAVVGHPFLPRKHYLFPSPRSQIKRTFLIQDD